jgi:FAD-linked oxidoreductase
VSRDGWSNWAGNQRCTPAAVESPMSEDELASVVKTAGAAGRAVRVVGSGHSFTDAAVTDGTMICLDNYRGVLATDYENRRVTVQAGITIAELNEALAARGLALPNLGDIGYQTISGALSTGTHGTGTGFGGLATQIAALDLVLADGSVLHCSDTEQPDVLNAARVSIGALGVLSTITLQCVPAFNLHAREKPQRFDEVLGELDASADDNDHFEFYWFPHTEWTYTKRNNRTDEPARPRGRRKEFVDDVVISNWAFGAVCALGKLRPAWIPPLARFSTRVLGGANTIDRSDRVFTSPRLVRFVEMEYSIPRPAVPDALRAVRAFIESRDLRISFPIEVRFTAPDDIPLSTASGRESGYIAVHVYRGMEFEPYFRGVEAIMNEHAGRPHWGKFHFQSADTLAPRYPKWAEFQSVRDRLDPERRFQNTYTRRVLGP